ncbi:glycoside hydrolase [Thermogutta sp.]|uniref:glycoside hydrolase n=1 Tax=Thermogutta sp. TaxID=1962930 RepID=UPI003C79FFE1
MAHRYRRYMQRAWLWMMGGLLLAVAWGRALSAVGVENGETGRQGPATHVGQDGNAWVLENAFLKVVLEPQSGAWEVLDKRVGHRWSSVVEEPKRREVLRNVQKVENDAISCETTLFWRDNKPYPGTVTLRLPADSADLFMTVDMPDREVAFSNQRFWTPLFYRSEHGVIAIADYCNGHLYPVTEEQLPRRWFNTSRLDMPWVGVCDLPTGVGYMILVETSDDGYVELRKVQKGDQFAWVPSIGWSPSMGKFSYPRKLIWHFVDKGGYVALAKRYRAYAQELGLIVPFSEKVKANPELKRLFGAPDVWGNANLQFAQEARQAGIRRLLVQGRMPPDQMRQVNELGYITSEYDNYTDVLPVDSEDKIDRSHDFVPQNVVLQANGERMKAWLTFDKKTQFMKRCPALWVRTAQRDIPKILAEYPFLGRFIDVTTAEDLYECYDPAHLLTRAQKRQCGVDLLHYVRSLKLVVGGEHGIWWAVPYVDYFEGMMSCNAYFSWPAGHLIPPKSKDEAFTSPWGDKLPPWSEYERWGIGHRERAPLWELVFHDCVVTTWYWGDSSDFLLQAAPEITPKKDAFNVLYGTIPLLWADRRRGSWLNHRDVFLRTYRNTCILHEVIAGTEMLNHEFVTENRDVQRTTFSDGTVVIVNFGSEPYELAVDGGNKYLLPQNGFYVKGPRIEQIRGLENGRIVTTIRTADYEHREEE